MIQYHPHESKALLPYYYLIIADLDIVPALPNTEVAGVLLFIAQTGMITQIKRLRA
jgi:hypothetical protein